MRSLFSLFLIGGFLALGFLPWDNWLQAHVSLGDVLLPPSLDHPLGTDNMGRDLLVRIAMAVRTTVLPLWVCVTLANLLGLVLALAFLIFSGLAGLPRLVLRIAFYGLASLPISLVVFAMAVWSEENSMLSILFALFGLFAVRSFIQLNDLFEHDARLGYWQAHEALGGSLWDRLRRYGLGRQWSLPLMEAYLFNLQVAISIEVALSYLGFGVSEPQASFGNMLASHMDLYLKGQWWTLLLIVVFFALSAYLPKMVFAVFKRPWNSKPRFARNPDEWGLSPIVADDC